MASPQASQTHIGSCVILIAFQILKVVASVGPGFEASMILRIIADAVFLCGIPTLSSYVHRSTLRNWKGPSSEDS
jgi:hypothetical protein